MHYWQSLRKHVGNKPLIAVGTAGAIVRDNRILLVRHRDKHLWQVPGGLLELGESVEEALEREIEEELHLKLKTTELLAVFTSPQWNITYSNGDTIQQVTMFFRMTDSFSTSSIELQEDEVEEWGLFPFDHIPNDTFPCCKEKVRILSSKAGKVVMR